ncbi:endonuclease/exonuclease/phosphatase family metal-dependent hydrolase [Lutibacter oceani]|uniref:Endonuclease/exonuclease/phosphatase family metal-dependent hydrolase n=1 Tax=Lutibacter oceani TaxID=1853311 RepID=A0A3D9RMG4_9FLAO|nr:endonuclease/exonuclease/phosphatase family protein [Lutibacter oceani]REE80768.1 endonuclease/exonuclease/phosphatase family metal-dependent hydrolase [Lutibacter oceani]
MKISKTVIVVIFTLLSIYSYAQTLDVITYNIRLNTASDGENAWPLRKDYLTSQIQFYEPDIFGVQEATPVQVEEITSILTQYNVVGIGRDGEGLGESSNIYFKKDRFILKETNTFWLSETPNEISMGWDAACNRVCTYALLKDKLSKKQLWVFNTHLDHIGEVARTKGLQLILEKIKKVNIKNFPVLLMGDFNSEPTSERIIELNKVMDDSKNVSEQKSFGPLGTFNGFKHNEPVTKMIDYIFISKNSNFRVLKHAILSDSKDLKYPSDHLPVYVKLIYK